MTEQERAVAEAISATLPAWRHMHVGTRVTVKFAGQGKYKRPSARVKRTHRHRPYILAVVPCDWMARVAQPGLAIIECDDGTPQLCLNAEPIAAPEGCDGAWAVVLTAYHLTVGQTVRGSAVWYGGRAWFSSVNEFTDYHEAARRAFAEAARNFEMALSGEFVPEIPF
jgi:hypothetical protein